MVLLAGGVKTTYGSYQAAGGSRIMPGTAHHFSPNSLIWPAASRQLHAASSIRRMMSLTAVTISAACRMVALPGCAAASVVSIPDHWSGQRASRSAFMVCGTLYKPTKARQVSAC
jgi:hypothetical protein